MDGTTLPLPARRFSRRAAAAAVVLLAAAVLLGGCAHVGRVLGATTTGTTTPADGTATGLATAAPGEEITSVADLVKRFGEPPDATFARIKIPVLGVDAPVARATVDANGDMPAATNPVEATWYDLSRYPALGGVPGEGGNAIIAGHVDYFAHIPYADGVLYRGKGVFGSLSLLSPGDVIEIDYQGKTLRYAVQWKQQVHANGGDWQQLFGSDTGGDAITLYTCTGDFSWTTREYSDRLVVRAQRVP